MTKESFYKKNCRKGIILFVVLGAIFVLSVLVISYNYLVRGKFNESREILKHVRATKCAQSLCKYISYLLQKDLNDPSSGLKEIFKENSAENLKNKLEKDWFIKKKIQDNCDNFKDALLVKTLKNEDAELKVEFGFTKPRFLNELKENPRYEDFKEDLFFDFEKVGRMTIRVTITIGHTREIWQETRPYKVVFPFPIPITKFNFYWKDGPKSGDEYTFNKVVLKSNGKYSKENKPFLFDNGSSLNLSNDQEDVWKKRGWIYVGGNNKLNLNRGGGNNSFGQNFYSFPRNYKSPPALILNFDNETVNAIHEIDNELYFRMACWGFSDSLSESVSNSWKEILKNDYAKHDNANGNYWKSSSLHFFSKKDMEESVAPRSESYEELNPTITRVIGNINDRFVEMGYFLSTSKSISAAVIDLSEDGFESANDSNEDDYPFGGYLFAPDINKAKNDLGYDKFQKLYNFFQKHIIKYKDDNPLELTYYQVMSKVKAQSISDVYDTIAQYSKSDAGKHTIDIPPLRTAPKTDNKKFWPDDKVPDNLKSLLGDKIKEDCNKVCEPQKDNTFGLGLRRCYKIEGNYYNTFNSIFSSSDGFGWNLNNLVIEVVAADSSTNIEIGDNISVNSPGAIFRKEGSLKVGDFSQANEPLANPLLLLTGKGEININNTATNNREVRAFLIALGEGGTVKISNPDNPLKIIGGMAVKEFSSENLPKSGGYLQYNTGLDFTNEDNGNFIVEHIGVALGPKGGRL